MLEMGHMRKETIAGLNSNQYVPFALGEILHAAVACVPKVDW